MTASAKRLGLAGVSGLAIAAALALAAPEAARACTFVPLTNAGIATGVNVTCAPDDRAAAFATSYGPSVFAGDPTTYTYDGNGADTIFMNGGVIVQAESDTSTPRDFVGGTVFLDGRTDTVETLGGDDRINVASGQIGTAAAPVSVFLGEGADVLSMSGGTIFGSVFGEAGDDEFRLSGGTISGVIFASDGNDFVFIDGATIGGAGADPDAIGLEDGDDRFGMRSGTVTGAVSGGDGADLLEVSGGTITGFLAGNAGVDRINVSGGTIGDGVQGNEGADQIAISGGNVGVVTGDEDDDAIAISVAAVVQQVLGGTGADTVTVLGGTVSQGIVTDLAGGPDGNDTVNISGGTIGANPDGGGAVQTLGGDDSVDFRGGTLNGSLATGAGNDTVAAARDAVLNGSVDLGAGNDRLDVDGAEISGDLVAGAGDDAVTVATGTVGGDIAGGAGNNTIAVSGGTAAGAIVLGGTDDTVTISGAAAVAGAIQGGSATNRITVGGGSLGGIGTTAAPLAGRSTIVIGGGAVGPAGSTGTAIALAGSDDSLTVNGGTVNGDVDTGAGSDTVAVGPGDVNGALTTGDGADTVVVAAGGSVDGPVTLGGGNDGLAMTGGALGAGVGGGIGDDTLQVSGGTVAGGLAGDGGSDRLTVSGNAAVTGGLGGGDDADQLSVSGGTVGGDVIGQDGDDRIGISGGTVAGDVDGGTGTDTVVLAGGAVAGGIAGGADNDALSVRGGSVADGVSGGGGVDTVAVQGGTVGGGVAGGDGDDAVTLSAGTINGDVAGGDGDDTVSVQGGTLNGGIDAETVRLSGGTVTGDVSGISADTLVIDDSLSAPALNLRDGVAFSGTGAVGTISSTALAAGGESQNFAGFASLTLAGSTLRFEGNQQVIDALALSGGSTLFVNGAASLRTQAGGFGSLSLNGATLNLIDGDPGDTLTLGGVVLDGATIGLDINQDTAQSDTLVANGIVTGSGANTILVNLVGTPQITDVTEIPILTAAGDPVGGTFAVAGITGTPASLFTYEVVQGPDGGLFLRATPIDGDLGAITAVDGSAAGQVAETMTDAIFAVIGDAAKYGLGLAGGPPSASASSFGVFASGQFAHVSHDGFTISDSGISVDGPSFSSNDFSAAISVDFNAAKHFQFDNEYGLNLGLFGGYTSTDLDLGRYRGFADAGDAQNESGMVGGYGLFRKELTYLLVSGTVLLGGTDVSNGIIGATGDYDTAGYAVTASAGRIFAIGERARFDLRGGVLGVSFKGDGYTDSDGLDHGESKVSFGAVKFEPGFYADYAWENGMVFSPYARAELQQRFNYENEASVQNKHFDFEDEDFSGAVMGGANLKISESATLSGEARGKFSSDSSTVAGKIGLKVAF